MNTPYYIFVAAFAAVFVAVVITCVVLSRKARYYADMGDKACRKYRRCENAFGWMKATAAVMGIMLLMAVGAMIPVMTLSILVGFVLPMFGIAAIIFSMGL